MSRIVVVDDTNPLISYQGQWTAVDNYTSSSANPVPLGGPPLDDTLHILSASESGSFAFNFSGTSVTVLGSFQGGTLPSWTCYINGSPLISNNSSDFNDSHVVMCQLTDIKTTFNNLTVVASVSTADSPFMFDCIQYVPDASSILDNATVDVIWTDSQIQYDSRWNMTPEGAETLVTGASLTFDFIGIQLTWISSSGFDPVTNTGSLVSSGFYSFDNGTQFPFLLTSQNYTPFETVSPFQSPILPPGLHSLFVQYYGNSGVENQIGSVPLILEYFIIQNLTIPTFTPSSPNTTSTSTQIERLSEGAIAGVVIGSVVGLALMIFILIWSIRSIKGPQTVVAVRNPTDRWQRAVGGLILPGRDQ